MPREPAHAGGLGAMLEIGSINLVAPVALALAAGVAVVVRLGRSSPRRRRTPVGSTVHPG